MWIDPSDGVFFSMKEACKAQQVSESFLKVIFNTKKYLLNGISSSSKLETKELSCHPSNNTHHSIRKAGCFSETNVLCLEVKYINERWVYHVTWLNQVQCRVHL
jgi:hypothetical protein